jgi:alpha-galactosidase
LDHEKDDAQSFADWGVDYLKYDNCYHMGRFGTPLISFERFNAMAEALKATGKNIFYSLCNWGEDYSYSVSLTVLAQNSKHLETYMSKNIVGGVYW